MIVSDGPSILSPDPRNGRRAYGKARGYEPLGLTPALSLEGAKLVMGVQLGRPPEPDAVGPCTVSTSRCTSDDIFSGLASNIPDQRGKYLAELVGSIHPRLRQ